nr:AAA family ATPase [Ornithinimicrobium sp. HY1745]
MTKIKFGGYKRLLDTGCNVDADLIAFVGPNEAGKTTVLEALAWLTEGGVLDPRKVNRTVETTLRGPVVTAIFALEASDLEALSDVDTAVEPRTLSYSRDREGATQMKFDPPLARNTALAAAVVESVSDPELSRRLEGRSAADSLSQVIDLANSGREWNEKDKGAVRNLIEWLELPVTVTSDRDEGGEEVERPAPESDLAAARLLKNWQTQMSHSGPEIAAAAALSDRVPEFLLFSERDRTLGFEYDLRRRSVNQGGRTQHVPSDDVEKPDGGLVNLLSLADTNIREFYDLVHAGVPERVSAHVRKTNKALNGAISPHWRQRPLEIRVEASDTKLRIVVDEGEDTARFTDRSEGLRIFVALLSFLARHTNDPPPVLLIDEADIHLHYNAQADLVNFLLELPSRTIYTTHSPGCLPLDLGTGIRVIKPSEADATSMLSNTFWDGDQPGFMPLLFAMGAGAAAFSNLRAAVFAEGPSDMMLLPTLIRDAAQERNLGYQIVPGLASIHPDKLGDTDYAAARVAYLLDGDGGGGVHQDDLLKAGVPRDRILRLPEGMATEDLIDPDAYLGAVNGVLTDAQRPEHVTIEQIKADLDAGVTIAKAVENALGGHDRAPGKGAVAGRLLRQDSLPLTEKARECLAAHHATLVQLLAVKRQA